ncbi:unnamed protein product [Cyprideis torosa]|uniref:Uncharacterized protein n=1 Tax=Cyprideis torosa TaxID=163714 RepID=A0A7R8WAF7_9CRUS|nr:unnamed protein product [Cyprideis torosa]CAG0890966.1 unnamed protein product [Cyprideis torosa]
MALAGPLLCLLLVKPAFPVPTRLEEGRPPLFRVPPQDSSALSSTPSIPTPGSSTPSSLTNSSTSTSTPSVMGKESYRGIVDYFNATRQEQKNWHFEHGIRHGYEIEGYEPRAEVYSRDVLFGPLLSRLDAYLSAFGATSEGCRKWLICKLGTSGEELAPFSNVVLRTLKFTEMLNQSVSVFDLFSDMRLHKRPTAFNPASFQLYKYYWASQIRGSDCSSRYDECEDTWARFTDSVIRKNWSKFPVALKKHVASSGGRLRSRDLEEEADLT